MRLKQKNNSQLKTFQKYPFYHFSKEELMAVLLGVFCNIERKGHAQIHFYKVIITRMLKEDKCSCKKEISDYLMNTDAQILNKVLVN